MSAAKRKNSLPQYGGKNFAASETSAKFTSAINNATMKMSNLAEKYLSILRTDTSEKVSKDNKAEFDKQWNLIANDVESLKNIRGWVISSPTSHERFFEEHKNLYLKYK